MKPRLLDLFCGAGGAAMGYHRAGFEVYGIDNKPQKNYPFPFLQMDALEAMDRLLRGEGLTFSNGVTLYLADIDAYHASPPCQDYSVVKSLHKGKEFPRLIEPILTRFRNTRKPYIIENVIGSNLPPQPKLDGTLGVMLCGTSFGLNIRRHRLFETSFPVPTLPCDHSIPIMDIYGDKERCKRMRELFPESIGMDFERHWVIHIGVSWMRKRNEWREAIPPAYTEYIGKYLMEYITSHNNTLSEPNII